MGRRTRITLTAAVMAAALPAQASAAPPANDDFERAAPVAKLPATLGGDLADATLQPGEPARADGSTTASVWYAWRPAQAQRIDLRFAEPPVIATAVDVYTGADRTALTRVAGTEPGRRETLEAVAGETYWIAVTARFQPPTRGSRYEAQVRPAPLPANDTFAAAQRVSPRGHYTGNLADATAELGEESHAGAPARHSVWFKFRAVRKDRMTIYTAQSTCQTHLAAYSGSSVAGLEEVASNVVSDDPGQSVSTIRFETRPGRTYYIAVDCPEPADNGDYVLSLSDGGIVGKGVELQVGPGQTVHSVRTRGLDVVVSTRRRVRLRIELVVGAGTARRLALGSRVLGRTTGVLDYDASRPAGIPLSPAAKAALRGLERLDATVRLTLLGSKARDRVLTVPVELRD